MTEPVAGEPEQSRSGAVVRRLLIGAGSVSVVVLSIAYVVGGSRRADEARRWRRRSTRCAPSSAATAGDDLLSDAVVPGVRASDQRQRPGSPRSPDRPRITGAEAPGGRASALDRCWRREACGRRVEAGGRGRPDPFAFSRHPQGRGVRSRPTRSSRPSTSPTYRARAPRSRWRRHTSRRSCLTTTRRAPARRAGRVVRSRRPGPRRTCSAGLPRYSASAATASSSRRSGSTTGPADAQA